MKVDRREGSALHKMFEAILEKNGLFNGSYDESISLLYSLADSPSIRSVFDLEPAYIEKL